MSGRPARLGSALALAFGAVLFVALLLALLDMARIEDLQTGPEFKSAAVNLRLIVVAEVMLVVVSAALAVWRVRRRTTQLLSVAAVIWILALFDLVIVGSAGAIPR